MLTTSGITFFISTLASLGHRAGLVFVQEGDVLAVWTLYRLGRSLPRNLPTINELAATAVTSQG